MLTPNFTAKVKANQLYGLRPSSVFRAPLEALQSEAEADKGKMAIRLYDATDRQASLLG